MLEKYVRKLFEKGESIEDKKIYEDIKNLLQANFNFIINYMENLGNIVFFITDRDLIIKYANKTFLRLVNLDNAVDKSLKVFLPPYIKYLPTPENEKNEKVLLHLKCRKPDINISLEGYVLASNNLLIFFLERRGFIYHELFEKISDLNNEIAKLTRESQKKDVLIENLKNELKETLRKDLVTEVFNRLYLKEALDREIGKNRRYKIPLSLVLVDIDNFKLINQNYGRTTGDKILRQFGKLLIENTRMVDMVFRVEEDNFILMLPNTNIEGANIVAKKIKNVANSTLFEGNVSMSVNTVAVECSSDDTVESLINKAYKAMHPNI
ncbi:MAG: GGDEF domain-containing protein [Thermodesulfovibrio sp.]|nr:GGDEF domain-containing protein [Thermodesulfovibrio sp.]